MACVDDKNPNCNTLPGILLNFDKMVRFPILTGLDPIKENSQL